MKSTVRKIDQCDVLDSNIARWISVMHGTLLLKSEYVRYEIETLSHGSM